MQILRGTAKRLLVAGITSALAVAGTVAVADVSAAATPAATITPASGSAAGGDLISVKGTGLMDASSASQVLAVRFLTAACGVDATAGTAATSYTVTSATKMVVTAPALAAGTWYLCIFDSTSSSAAGVLGQAKFVTGAAPTITFINGIAEAAATAGNDITASSLGGTNLTILGTGFSKKTTVSVGGSAAKTTYVSATKVTAVLPAKAATTDLAVKVTTEYGTASSVEPLVDYQSVISISPNVGAASTVQGIEMTGAGFSGFTFGTAVNQYSIAFVAAGVNMAAGQAVPLTGLCTSITVENDTTLSCKSPNNLSGAYTVYLVKRDGTVATNIGSTNALSRSATYTAANI